MARRTGRAPLLLSAEQRSMLSELAGSRTGAQREVERAKVLLACAEDKSSTEIQRALGVSRPTIYKCIDKALAAGVAAGLRDRSACTSDQRGGQGLRHRSGLQKTR